MEWSTDVVPFLSRLKYRQNNKGFSEEQCICTGLLYHIMGQYILLKRMGEWRTNVYTRQSRGFVVSYTQAYNAYRG
jgi:hypothetical protein